MSIPRIDPRKRALLRTVHIGATVSVLGADLALLSLGLSGLRGADPLTIYPAAHLVAERVIVPLAFLSLGTGVLLGLLTPWGLTRHLGSRSSLASCCCSPPPCFSFSSRAWVPRRRGFSGQHCPIRTWSRARRW